MTMISAAIRATHRALDSAYMEQDPAVTMPQLAVLVALVESGPMIQTDIVAKAGIDRSTLGPLLDRLAAMGMITRLRGNGLDTDARTRTVELTKDGRKAAAQCGKMLVAAELELTGKLSQVNRQAFLHAFEQMAAARQNATEKRKRRIRIRRRR